MATPFGPADTFSGTEYDIGDGPRHHLGDPDRPEKGYSSKLGDPDPDETPLPPPIST